MNKLPIPIQYARELRKTQTPEEKIIWSYVRNRKLSGYKFLRQHPIIVSDAFFIADFYCDEKKLVIEIDGGIHKTRKEYDNYRDDVMRSIGLTVLRITNEEVNGDVYAVLKRIRDALYSPLIR